MRRGEKPLALSRHSHSRDSHHLEATTRVCVCVCVCNDCVALDPLDIHARAILLAFSAFHKKGKVAKGCFGNRGRGGNERCDASSFAGGVVMHPKKTWWET